MKAKKQILSQFIKNGKQITNNYRPVFLLSICSKMFEKIIFNSLLKYLEDDKHLNYNQPGFRLGDSCVHQLLPITHEIDNSFDASYPLEVREVFLDISFFSRVFFYGH